MCSRSGEASIDYSCMKVRLPDSLGEITERNRDEILE